MNGGVVIEAVGDASELSEWEREVVAEVGSRHPGWADDLVVLAVRDDEGQASRAVIARCAVVARGAEIVFVGFAETHQMATAGSGPARGLRCAGSAAEA